MNVPSGVPPAVPEKKLPVLSEQPRFAVNARATSTSNMAGMRRRRPSGRKKQSSPASEIAPSIRSSLPPFRACCDSFSLGATVVIVIVVVPAPVSVVGVNEQVICTFDGGVQPNDTVPVKPPLRPRRIVAWPLLPG